MEQKFLIKDGYPLLTLFFSGWGGEECLFAGYRPSGSDFLLCCDYRNLDFDPSLLEGYRGIKVVAWSLGVWVAGHVLQGKEAGFTEMIAVNGTPVPVDDRYGIPEQIFKGTLEHMDDTVLKKFRRRMCGTAEGLLWAYVWYRILCWADHRIAVFRRLDRYKPYRLRIARRWKEERSLWPLISFMRENNA